MTGSIVEGAFVRREITWQDRKSEEGPVLSNEQRLMRPTLISYEGNTINHLTAATLSIKNETHETLGDKSRSYHGLYSPAELYSWSWEGDHEYSALQRS